jgi:oxygen-independent coproporphyrinogen-3 oxidase
MARDGLVTWDGYRLAVTRTGRPFVRTVAAAFDTWLRQDAPRHSAAV